MIELTGVLMTADSLRFIPYATVSINNKDKGTTASQQGVFSMICEKGDTVDFTSVGYRKKRYIIPSTLVGNRFSIIQLMTQDTFYLPETIIRPYPSKEQFDYAFKYTDIPDDIYEIARKNTEKNALRAVAENLARDGGENQGAYQNIMRLRTNWEGQQAPQYIFSPLAWADFIKAWKRGDFRKKKKVNYNDN